MTKVTITSQIQEPNNVEVSLTITMKLAHWNALRDQLAAGNSLPNWPALVLFRAIRELTEQCEEQISKSIGKDAE